MSILYAAIRFRHKFQGIALKQRFVSVVSSRKKKTFIEEYKELLEKFEIIYDERYIFKEVM